MRKLLFVALACLPLSGCFVAGTAAGVVAGNQLINNNIYVRQVGVDAKTAWVVTKKFLSENSQEVIDADDSTRVANANIDNAQIQVRVEAWDVDECRITVSAKRLLSTVNDGELARVFSDRLARRLEK
ncbi:MAG: hypothetical protein IT454_13760 [Planctomycetes bacterium]|nr:hypothetical protein [Planctomycetota bacterium]